MFPFGDYAKKSASELTGIPNRNVLYVARSM